MPISRAMPRRESAPGPCSASWRRARDLISSIVSARRRALRVGVEEVVALMPSLCHLDEIGVHIAITALDKSDGPRYSEHCSRWDRHSRRNWKMNGMHNADMGGMMQGPWHGAVMAVMAAGAGLSLLLWLVLIALGGLA